MVKEEEKDKVHFNHDDIQQKLDKKLGPEYISKRIGFGSSRVAYIEGWRAINLANQIFGYNGWSTEVKNIIVDFLDERQGKFSIGCTAIVRVSLADGTYREDIGYGAVENERRKPAAFERAKKSAVTDALKRCLRGFGNALGNCLYDKEFLSRIDKVKFDPPDFDEGNLFRPSDEISEYSRSSTIDNDNPAVKRQKLNNQNSIPDTNKVKYNGSAPAPAITYNNAPKKPVQSEERCAPNGSRGKENAQNKSENEDLLDDSFMFSDDLQDDELISLMNKNSSDPDRRFNNAPKENTGDITFVTARAADSYQSTENVPENLKFDPKYVPHSMKLTIDQNTSKHIPLSVLKEKGVTATSREAIYSRFAAKGKQIPNPIDDSTDSRLAENDKSNENDDTETSHSTEIEKSAISSVNNGTNISGSTESSVTTVPSHNSTSQTTNIEAKVDKADSQVSEKQSQKGIKYAPQVPVVHPNTSAAIPLNQNKPLRREVGRPKINNVGPKKPSPTP